VIRTLLEKVRAIGSKALYVVDEICAGVLVVMSLLMLAGVVASAAYLVYLGALWLPNTLVLVVAVAVVAACARAVWCLWQAMHDYEIDTALNLLIATVFSGIAYVSDLIKVLVEKVNK